MPYENRKRVKQVERALTAKDIQEMSLAEYQKYREQLLKAVDDLWAKEVTVTEEVTVEEKQAWVTGEF